MNKNKKKLLKKRLRNRLIKEKIKKQIKFFILNRNEKEFKQIQSKMMKAVKKKVFKMKCMSRKIISLKKLIL